jgi:predicted secreted Zn-dependent protease
MTEEEAKAKWCPFSRVSYDALDSTQLSPSFNRTVTDKGPEGVLNAACCIGSACMAWRHNALSRNRDGVCGLVVSAEYELHLRRIT